MLPLAQVLRIRKMNRNNDRDTIADCCSQTPRNIKVQSLALSIARHTEALQTQCENKLQQCSDVALSPSLVLVMQTTWPSRLTN